MLFKKNKVNHHSPLLPVLRHVRAPTVGSLSPSTQLIGLKKLMCGGPGADGCSKGAAPRLLRRSLTSPFSRQLWCRLMMAREAHRRQEHPRLIIFLSPPPIFPERIKIRALSLSSPLSLILLLSILFFLLLLFLPASVNKRLQTSKSARGGGGGGGVGDGGRDLSQLLSKDKS